MRRMPSRQGVHLPHDSSLRKSKKYRAMSTMQWSVHDDHPTRPHDGADLGQVLVIHRQVQEVGRMQPPEGPPVCTALSFLLRPGTPPPMFMIKSRKGMPMGTSTSPVVLDLADQRKDHRPFAGLGPDLRSTIWPRCNDLRDGRPGLDVC